MDSRQQHDLAATHSSDDTLLYDEVLIRVTRLIWHTMSSQLPVQEAVSNNPIQYSNPIKRVPVVECHASCERRI